MDDSPVFCAHCGEPCLVIDYEEYELCCLCAMLYMCVACYERAGRPEYPRLTDEQADAFLSLMTDKSILTEVVEIKVVPERQLKSLKYEELPEPVRVNVVPGRKIRIPYFTIAGPYGYEGPANFTCDECRFKSLCRYSYDGYNTNGDCLASK